MNQNHQKYHKYAKQFRKSLTQENQNHEKYHKYTKQLKKSLTQVNQGIDQAVQGHQPEQRLQLLLYPAGKLIKLIKLCLIRVEKTPNLDQIITYLKLVLT